MTMITVNCKGCGKEFEKQKNHYTYTEKMKRLHFCSQSCAGKFGQANLTPEQKQRRSKKLVGYHHDSTDDLSPFREYLKRTRDSQNRRKMFAERPNLDLPYLKQLWELQKGMCPYTGIKMIIGRNMSECRRTKSPKLASLDRIDSTKGYIKGNVEFVCCSINFAKNSFTKKQMLEFINEIKNAEGSLGV